MSYFTYLSLLKSTFSSLVRKPVLSLFIAVSVFSIPVLKSQDIIWDFGTSTGNATPSINTAMNMVGTPTVIQGNNNGTTTMLTSTSASNNSGASGQFNAGAAARIGALNTGASGSAYFEFTLTPDVGFFFTLTSISFNSRSTGTGPQAYSLRTSLDSYASDYASGTFPNTSTWLAYPNTGLSIVSASGTPVTFRLYAYNGAGAAAINVANWRIDDLNLGLTVTSSLPVTLLNFSAGISDNNALLSFSTTTEINNDYFTIERSADGHSFEAIGQVKGAGTTRNPQHYTFTDDQPFAGKNYYRLRQTDLDGKISFSAVINVVFTRAGNITLSPSPAKDLLHIQLDQPAAEEGLWQVFDISGRLIQSGVWESETDGASVNTGSMTSGTYALRLVMGQTVTVKQFRKI